MVAVGSVPSVEHPSAQVGRSLGMKKISVICMILLTGLVGCAGQRAKPWRSLTYHVTSSVQAEGCHFFLIRDDGGSMTLTGYCFADGSEYVVYDRANLFANEILNLGNKGWVTHLFNSIIDIDTLVEVQIDEAVFSVE